MVKSHTSMDTVKIPSSYQTIFNSKIKPRGKYINYPDFVRDAVRKQIEKLEGKIQ